jgi:hypothetical protein
MNIFDLNRNFWDFAFSNPEKIKPNHCAIYYFALEHCNRLGWKEKFGYPTSMVLEATGIKSYSVYKKTFDELVDFGFFEVIEYSRNQYSSNIIALKENIKANNKADSKALDKAFINHNQNQCKSIDKSIDSIDIQINNTTNLQLNKSTNIKTASPKFSFLGALIEYGFDRQLVEDWLKVRKTKKATNTQTAFNKFIEEVEQRSCNINEILEICVEKSWSGFKWTWVDNLKQTNTFNNGRVEKTPEQLASDIFNSETARNFRFS